MRNILALFRWQIRKRVQETSAWIQQWLSVGKLVNTHGIRGEVKVLPQTDFPEERFAPSNSLDAHRRQRSAASWTLKSYQRKRT